jgi:hypothetical protein
MRKHLTRTFSSPHFWSFIAGMVASLVTLTAYHAYSSRLVAVTLVHRTQGEESVRLSLLGRRTMFPRSGIDADSLRVIATQAEDNGRVTQGAIDCEVTVETIAPSLYDSLLAEGKKLAKTIIPPSRAGKGKVPAKGKVP